MIPYPPQTVNRDVVQVLKVGRSEIVNSGMLIRLRSVLGSSLPTKRRRREIA